MAHDQGPLFRFEHQLRLEVDRVLADVVFRRAPIQSRLLHYLMERTISDPNPPTQFEIAVDGLGKSSEYDIENDSYPRVQVSRLKRNLQNYYARNQPGNGLKVELFDGSYRLRLVPSKSTEEVVDQSIGEPGTDEVQAADRERTWLRAGVLVSVAIWTVGLIGFGIWYFADTSPQSDLVAPTTALILDLDASEGNVQIPADITQGVEQIGKLQLRNSFVSRPALPIENADDAQYIVSIISGVRSGQPALFLTLFSSEGDVLYTHTIAPASERTPEFESELETALAYVTSPSGAIAKNELKGIEEATTSDYACFLSIENSRSRAEAMGKLIERCIARYPRSSYAAFWHARRSFILYQAALMRGEPVRKQGEAWEELSTALKLGPTNTYANFLAAKVAFASGECESGHAYAERAFERATTYPAMLAASKMDGAICTASVEDTAETLRRLRAMARFTPDRDPLLDIQLMLGMVAMDDRAGAQALAETLTFANPDGAVEEATALVALALRDRSVANARRSELKMAIRMYVWNPLLAEEILNRIIA